MKKTQHHYMLMHGFILVTILATAKSAEAEITMEAAFQGHCGHTSPCEQLCYEIHDGMYECDCIEGYELNKNGYSCQVINSTSSSDGHSKSDEDVLYQKGASFSAKLANDDSERDTQRSASYSVVSSASSSSASGSEEDTDDTEIFFNDDLALMTQKQKVNSQTNVISAESINFSNNQADINTNNYNDVPEFGANLVVSGTQQQSLPHEPQHSEQRKTTAALVTTTTTLKPIKKSHVGHKKHRSKSTHSQRSGVSSTTATTSTTTAATTTTTSTTTKSSTPKQLSRQQAMVNSNLEDDYYMKQDMSIYDDVNNNQLNLRPLSARTYQGQSAYTFDSSSMSIQNDNQNQYGDIDTTSSTEVGSRVGKEGRAVSATARNVLGQENISTTKTWSGNGSMERLRMNNSEPCNLDCGVDGVCDDSDSSRATRCLCPFGKTGNNCLEDLKVRVPKFSKKSWLAFPALRGAYKHVQIRIEFRPESFDGIILLSGERDDLTGDFMALLLNKGFVEFWFDCGSGVGSVRSKETILLNEWNSVIIYRHRWDAWLVLNHGTRVQGRSNGLFSRITFREPVFLGGTGNITGLAKRLPVNAGFIGCIRRFVANEHEYKFEEHPLGDVSKGFDIQDCVTDKCFKYPCQHGGKCLPSDQGAVCLCPIGFVGDLCEIRMDLQVPAFNGSSFLRYAPLGDSALIWLELKVILKPEHPDGIILYAGPQHQGDFVALYLNNGYVEFGFELGSGPALVRSEHPLSIGQWHTIKISRTARLAVLKIDNSPEVMTIASNGFWHLSLPHNLFLGGVNHADNLPLDLKYKPYFMGCIQKVDINGHALSIISEALGGTNIGNCPHACVARPCGPLAQCIPQMESYECRCSAFNDQCNKAAELPLEELQKVKNRGKLANAKHLEYEQKMKKIRAYKQVKSSIKSQANRNLYKSTTVPPTSRQFVQQDHIDDDDIIFRDVHAMMHRKSKVRKSKEGKNEQNAERKTEETTQRNVDMKHISKKNPQLVKEHHQHQHHAYHQTKYDPHHKHPVIERKLSRLPTHYESFQTNPESDILTFDNVEFEMNSHERQPHGDEKAEEEEVASEELVDDEHYTDERLHSNENQWEHEQYQEHNHDHEHSAEYDQEHNHEHIQDHYHNHDHDQDHFHALDHDEDVDQNQDHDHSHDEDLDFAQDHNHEHNFTPNVGALEAEPFSAMDESLFDENDDTDEAHKKQFAQDMKRIMGNTHAHIIKMEQQQREVMQPENRAKHDRSVDDVVATDLADDNNENTNDDHNEDHDDDDDLLEPVESVHDKPNAQSHTDWSVLGRFDLTGIDRQIGVKKNFGACFAGSDSYFHYNDAETMSQIISYNIDLNLRIKTHSHNGVILWTGRQSATDEDDDYLSLGIENGYLHFRYDLGSGEVDIRFNTTKVSDGLWHRVRAIRDSQEGHLEVDGRKSPPQRAPGRLRQLNTDTGLYVGGMPDTSYFTRRKYQSGIVGCISEIILAGELKLNFDPNTLGTAHNVETGIL